MTALSRRSFLASLGVGAGGLLIGGGKVWAANAPSGLSPNVFVHIAADGVVSIICHRSEMGQGVRSTIPALIADELGAELSTIRIVQAVGDKKYGDQNTDGSSSIRRRYKDLREAGALGRMLLVSAAAKRWRVKEETCLAEGGQVLHPPSKRALPFSALVGDAAKLPAPKTLKLKLRSQHKYIGTALPLVDGLDIVTGRGQFGADVVLPGMLTAVVLHPPVVGAIVKSFDDKAALDVRGVRQVVKLPTPKPPWVFQSLGGFAVVADNTWAAMRGRAALTVTWDAGENASYDSDSYRAAQAVTVRSPGKVVRKKGDVDAALKSATRTLTAEYFTPHLAHAPMEPPCATAHVKDDACEVWACTQNPQAARTAVAAALGIAEDKVTVHVTLLGGGFGRKSKPDYVAEAALVSKAVGAPVRLQWSREDDIQSDFFHTTCAQHLEAGLDSSGAVTAWLHRTTFPPIASTFTHLSEHGGEGEVGQGVLDFPLSIPNVQGENGPSKAKVRIGWLRSVNNVHHAFGINSFLDEIAHARGLDPKVNLLEIIGAPRMVTAQELGVAKVPNYGASLEEHPLDTARMRHVIERVTELSAWSQRRDDKERGYGLAFHNSFLCKVAAVVAVKRLPNGKIKVDEAWVVADAGLVVNRERAHSQFEGAVLFGMSIAMFSQITVKGGAVQQSNFRDYRLARMADAPRAIHVEVVESEANPGGIGEPGVPPIAPAIVNAVFALTGQRVRRLPLSLAELA